MNRIEILILPNFFTMHGIYRAYVTSTIADFLMEQGVMASMPFIPTYLKKQEEIRAYVHDLLDTNNPRGIILQGGTDICAEMYTDQTATTQRETIPFRDYFEKEVILWAVEKGIPILGICRGLQMLNVALGGTLHDHLDEGTWIAHEPPLQNHHVPELIAGPTLGHSVLLEDGGELYKIFQREHIEVNSYHHQGIDRLAPGLFVEGRSEDGLIEAVSSKDKKILAVQWHPELDFAREDFRKPIELWLSWLA